MRSIAAALLILIPLTLSAVEPGPVVFSELMWMGSTTSASDEWIELANRSEEPVDLAGWTITRIRDGSELHMLEIEAGVLAPGQVFLISNFPPDDPRCMLAVEPDMVTSAVVLPNTRLDLRLYDGDPEAGATLIDRADNGVGAPIAGDLQQRHAMVRIHLDADGTLPTSWATAQEAIGWKPGATEMGTPGSLREVLSGMPATTTEPPAQPNEPGDGDQTADPGDTSGDQSETAVHPVSWAQLKGHSRLF